MGNIRVHYLAKELDIKSVDLLKTLKEEGVPVKNYMSAIDGETAELIRSMYGEKKKKEKSHEADTHKEERPPESKAINKDLIISIEEYNTVKDLAQKMNIAGTEIIKQLLKRGILATINQSIDQQAAKILCEDFGFQTLEVSVENELEQEDEEHEEDYILRPPVVTIMGHVDHGKTTLLDSIRKTNVTSTEAGGITQHIGAYSVQIDRGTVTFLDTPGHEAFTAMRARGAQATDIVVLVVAADDGIMPQTEEAIDHAFAAKVPVIVAINKIDKPNSNPDRVRKELADRNLAPEEWGGTTIYANVSALKKEGIENLLEMILLQAEVMELKGNPKPLARGVVIEAKLHKGRGPVATVLVQKGTLRVGDVFVVGASYGRIRALFNDCGKKVKSASLSIPAEVLGMNEVPKAGDSFVVVKDEKRARQISNARMQKRREDFLKAGTRITLDDLYQQINQGIVKTLNLIIKADTQGSVQAIKESLIKLSAKEVQINVIHGGVGGITESDVLLASASNAIIIGFNVRPTDNAQPLSEREKIDLRLYTVIYDAINDVKAAMEGLLEPTLVEKVTGRAEVRQIFSIPKIGKIAGCYVTEGVITRNSEGRLIRDSVVIHQGKISSLRRFKEDAKEVASGYECGISFDSFNDLKEGDIIEPFFFEKIPKKI
jgi:translation initiation factor IF-2